MSLPAVVQEGRGGGKPRKWWRSEWHERMLKAKYDSRPTTVDELQRAFGVPRWMVKKWARELGLSRTRPDDWWWTEEQKSFLEKWWGRRHPKTVARHLKKTETACALKAKRIGLRANPDGAYSLRQVCEGLGEDHKKIRGWVASAALRATRRGTARTEAQGGDIWAFTPEAIRHFVRRHPLEVNLKKVDQLWFMDVVVGIIQL